MRIRSIALFTLMASLVSLGIGQDASLLMLDGIPASYINPAFKSNHKIFVSLGSVQASYGNEAFRLKDAIRDKDDRKELDFTAISQVIPSGDSRISLENRLQTLEAGYSTDKWAAYFGHGFHSYGEGNLTPEIVNLLAKGNAAYIGDKVDISLNANTQSWHEIYLGYSRQIGNFSIGGRVKYLNGVQYASITDGYLGLQISDEIYQAQLNTDIELYSSTIFDYQSIDDININNRGRSWSSLFTENYGWGLDIGASVTLSKVSIFLSGLNMGSIDWDTDTYLYESKKQTQIDGVDILDLIDDDYQYEDTLKAKLDFDKTATTFTSTLPTIIMLGGKYLLDDKTQLGVVLRRSGLSLSNTAVTLMAQRKINKYLTLGINGGYANKSIANIGGLVLGTFGPFNVYASSSNIAGLVAPEQFKSIDVRVGIYLAFKDLY